MIHNLANALVARGHSVTVVAKKISWGAPSDERGYSLKQYSLPIRGTGNLGIDFFSSIMKVFLAHKAAKFDVLNCHGVSYSGTRARHLKRLLAIPVVMTPHGQDVQKISSIEYGLRLDAKWDMKISKNLKAANYVTAISRSVRSDIDMIPAKRIVDIPNGIDTERFSGTPSNFLHQYLGISESRKIILSVGRNHIKKGYDYGIKAMSVLVKKSGRDDVHYVIVGRGVTEHRKLVGELKAESYVSLVDEVPPEMITQCYRSADIFFSPSLVEGLSLVSIEAMASGLPLVVTDVPGNDDVVRENGCGVIVESKDVSSMSDGLYKLLTNQAYTKSLAELSLRCSKKYDWSRIAAQYEDVYLRAMNTNNIAASS